MNIADEHHPFWTHAYVLICLQEALDAADVTGGLSLGEYTALTFAGAMRYSRCYLHNE